MVANVPLDEDDVTWLNKYASEVHKAFGAEFCSAEDRFPRWKSPLQRFTRAVDYVLKHGRGYFGAVDEAHNEVCIASAILANIIPRLVRLDYEPTLPGCAKSIDFRAVAEDGTVFYVDVKTITPAAKDRWEQYEKAQREQWFPENVRLILHKDWLAGEMFHSAFTARSRILEHAHEFEAKIEEAGLNAECTRFVMAFCGNGFHWHPDELEDFVSFYVKGWHRADDPFSQTELNSMAEKGLRLNRTITSFARMTRTQGELRQSPIDWNVYAPHDAFT